MRFWVAWIGAGWTLLGVGACSDEDSASAPAADAGAATASLSSLKVTSPACGGADPCDTCMAASCSSQYVACFGSSWQTDLGGVCSAFGDCITACDCGDPSCFRACNTALESNPADPCYACIQNLLACEVAHCDSECGAVAPDAGRDARGN